MSITRRRRCIRTLLLTLFLLLLLWLLLLLFFVVVVHDDFFVYFDYVNDCLCFSSSFLSFVPVVRWAGEEWRRLKKEKEV